MSVTTIALAQVPSLRGDITTNVHTHLSAIQCAQQQGVDYVLFPELSLTGYELDLAAKQALTVDDPRLRPFIDAAMQYQMSIAIGMPLRQQGQLYIGQLVFKPDGGIESYAKIHLHEGEAHYFSSGHRHYCIQVGDLTIASAICADTNHPKHADACATLGANVYLAGVLISPSGYAADSAALADISRQHPLLVGVANHCQSTGGWAVAGTSAFWADGEIIIQADDSSPSLVIIKRQEAGWQGQIIPL